MRAETAMTRRVVYVSPNDSLQDAWEIMTEWEIRHLPVLDGGRLVGILSDRDVLINSSKEEAQFTVSAMTIAEAMTANPMTCSPDTSICEICDLMLDHKIDSLPIIADDQLVGLVTSSDLVQLLRMRETPQVRQRLPFRYELHSHRRPVDFRAEPVVVY
jgi:acetoin utilization protein AcuB